MSDIKTQSAFEHERWLARKAGDRQKGKRVPRCQCSYCVDSRVHAGRGRSGRLSVRVDEHEVHSPALAGFDLKYELEYDLVMDAIRASLAPTSAPRPGRVEVSLGELVREPRSRRKG